jgi:hypothetical protein
VRGRRTLGRGPLRCRLPRLLREHRGSGDPLLARRLLLGDLACGFVLRGEARRGGLLGLHRQCRGGLLGGSPLLGSSTGGFGLFGCCPLGPGAFVRCPLRFLGLLGGLLLGRDAFLPGRPHQLGSLLFRGEPLGGGVLLGRRLGHLPLGGREGGSLLLLGRAGRGLGQPGSRPVDSPAASFLGLGIVGRDRRFHGPRRRLGAPAPSCALALSPAGGRCLDGPLRLDRTGRRGQHDRIQLLPQLHGELPARWVLRAGPPHARSRRR